MFTRRAQVWFVVFVSALALVGAGAGAQIWKVSPPSRRGPSGSVESARITPDGSAVVYLLAPYDHGEQEQSFFLATDAGARRIENVGSGAVEDFAISPDSRFLVYFRRSATESGLFSVALDGSLAPRALTPPELGPSSDSSAPRFVISAQDRVVFAVDGAGGRALYSVSLTDDPRPVRLDGPHVHGATLRGFEVSPDGDWVAYLANPEDLEQFELFLAPITGALPARKLNAPLVTGGGVRSFEFSPTSQRVVYLATQDRAGSEDVHSAAVLVASPPIRLDPDEPSSAHVDSFAIAPDGSSVVYRRYRTGSTTLELFRVPIEGGVAPTRVNATLVSGGRVMAFALASDGSVVYSADQEVRNREELYHAANGGAVTKLNAPLAPNQDVEVFRVAPQGNRVVYSVYAGVAVTTFLATLDGSIAPVVIWPSARPFSFAASGERVVFRDGQSAIGGLFSLRLDGVSTPLELMHAGPGFLPATDFQLELAGERVVSRVSTGSAYELFAAPLAGGAPQRLSAPLPMGAQIDDAWSPELTRGGRWTVFGFGPSLFSADLERRTPPIQLTTEANPPNWFLVAPRGGRVVFRAAADKVYSVPIDARAQPILVDAVPTTEEIRVSPDGGRVLYLDAQRRLHSAALDGTSPSVLLGGFPAQGNVLFHGYRVSADGARVVYHFAVSGESEVRLLSAPIDGSAAPVQLDPSLATDELIDVAAGERVVFQTRFAGLVSLWSVPLDASAAPTPLATEDIRPQDESAPVVVAGDRVVFTVRYGELFSVPVDGSEVRRELAPGLACRAIEAPGARVFFVGRPTSGAFADLYSVPADGSTAPVRLSRASTSGTVLSRRVSLDGARVVYLQQQDCSQVLCSTASDGSTEPVRLSALTDCDGLAGFPNTFQLSADGRMVTFEIATWGYLRELDELSEIFAVPSDGSAAPIRVNASPPAINDFPVFRLDPAGRFVLFTADLDEESVHELYLAPIVRVHEQTVTR